METLNYTVKSPILFLVFNRPDVTSIVFEQIKKVKPSRLYVAADGPRKKKEGEEQLCNDTRKIIDQVDWECDVKTLFRNENLGCKYAVSSGISWFFEHEEEGIVLEDDCLPNTDFFVFCDSLLEKYRTDSRITHIGGCNFQFGTKWGDGSYYFSNLTHVWGWASWRRAWKNYDVELKKYERVDASSIFNKIFDNVIVTEKWESIYNDLLEGKIDTWDYQLALTNMFSSGLSIIPNVNLIKNIGFGSNATHTFDTNDVVTNMQLESLESIVHPSTIKPQKEADFFTLNREFDVEKNKRKRRIKKIVNFLKFWKK